MDDRVAAKAMIPASVELLLRELHLDPLARIADVGANPVNEPPYTGLLGAGGCEVIGFEPDERAFRALEATKSDLETYFPHAVGNGTTKEPEIFRNEGMTSLLEPDEAAIRVLGRPRWAQITARRRLDTVTLDAVPGLGDIDLLKIDIQGGEVDVFRGAKSVLGGAVAVITEVRFFPLYVDEPMLGGVDQELRSQGFQLHKFMFEKARALPNSQSRRFRPRRIADQLIDGDAVYVRDLRALDEFTDRMLGCLALFAGAVFESHSLCLCCLDALSARGAAPVDLARRYADLLSPSLKLGKEK